MRRDQNAPKTSTRRRTQRKCRDAFFCVFSSAGAVCVCVLITLCKVKSKAHTHAAVFVVVCECNCAMCVWARASDVQFPASIVCPFGAHGARRTPHSVEPAAAHTNASSTRSGACPRFLLCCVCSRCCGCRRIFHVVCVLAAAAVVIVDALQPLSPALPRPPLAALANARLKRLAHMPKYGRNSSFPQIHMLLGAPCLSDTVYALRASWAPHTRARRTLRRHSAASPASTFAHFSRQSVCLHSCERHVSVSRFPDHCNHSHTRGRAGDSGETCVHFLRKLRRT